VSSPTSLDGFLRFDEDNLTLRLTRWFHKVDPSRTAVLHVYFKPMHGSRMESLTRDDPITCSTPELVAVDGVIEEIERVIVEKHGDNPMGPIRVQGYLKGESRVLGVDFSRTLTPPEMPHGDPGQHLLQLELHHYRARCATLEEHMVTFMVAQQSLTTGLGDSLQKAATTRTVSSSSSDLSSIAAIVGFMILMIGKPAIARFFGLKEDATTIEITKAMQRWLLTESTESHAPRVPKSAITDSGTVPVIEGGRLDGVDASGLLAELDALPELRDQLIRMAAVRPDLQQLAQQAAIDAALDNGT